MDAVDSLAGFWCLFIKLGDTHRAAGLQMDPPLSPSNFRLGVLLQRYLHLPCLNILYEMNNISFAHLDGTLNLQQREKVIKQFYEESDVMKSISSAKVSHEPKKEIKEKRQGLRGPDFTWVLKLMTKVKDGLCELSPSSWRQDIKNNIDLDMLSQCRQRGHTLTRCPFKSAETSDKKMCYSCGETEHSLSECLQPLQNGGTKFASCFICKEQGHLSKNCPKNKNGVYHKGGCCKVCGEVTHLAKDCP